MRLGQRHGARCTAVYLKLADGRTAMKNTDAVFIRRRMGAKDIETDQRIHWSDFDAVFARFELLARFSSIWGGKFFSKKSQNTKNKRKTDGTALVETRTGSFLPLGVVCCAAWRTACPTTTTCSFRIHWWLKWSGALVNVVIIFYVTAAVTRAE